MPQPVEFIAELEDRAGRKASTSIKISSFNATAPAPDTNISVFGQAWATALDNISACLIRAIFAVVQIDISALTGNLLDPDSDVEEVGAFEFVTVQGNRVKFNVPAIDELQTVSTTGELDQTDPDIAALITMMTDGIAVTGGTIIPCDVGEEDIAGLLYARERSRNSGARKVNY